MIFSSILPRHAVSEIGLHDPGDFGSLPSFKIGLITAVLQRCGIGSPFHILLYMCRIYFFAFGSSCLMMSYGMVSSPGALFALVSLVTLSNSSHVISLSYLLLSVGTDFRNFRFCRLMILSFGPCFILDTFLYTFANCLAFSLSLTYALSSTTRTSFSFLGAILPSMLLIVFHTCVQLVFASSWSTYSRHLSSFSLRIISPTTLHLSIHFFLPPSFFISFLSMFLSSIFSLISLVMAGLESRLTRFTPTCVVAAFVIVFLRIFSSLWTFFVS